MYNLFANGPILFPFSDDQVLLVHDGLEEMHFRVCVLFHLETTFELSLCPTTKWIFLSYQHDGISYYHLFKCKSPGILSFLTGCLRLTSLPEEMIGKLLSMWYLMRWPTLSNT